MARAEEYVCSPMQGQLVDESGTVVANVDVRREWFWGRKSGSDMARTDNDGHFSFGPIHAKKGLFGFLPGENPVRQNYFALMPGGEFEFLYLNTRNLQLNEESGGKPFNVRCTIGIQQGKDDIEWGTCKLID